LTARALSVQAYVPLVIASLFGIMRVRFATLWPVVTSCLATAGAAYPDETWRTSIVLFLAAGADRDAAAGPPDAGAVTARPIGSKRIRRGEDGVTDDISRRVARYLPSVVTGTGVDILIQRYHSRLQECSGDAGGFTDTETYHSCMCGVFAAAPGLAESRSRLLVPIFMVFMRDDYYGCVRACGLLHRCFV
jgi:hypothetical protein